MTIDDQIKDEKLQYYINREAAKISVLSSDKIDKYESLTGKEMLPSNQKQIIEQGKFACSPLGKAFEKQIKAIEDQREKQVKEIQTQREIKTIESNKGFDNKSHKIFRNLLHERMIEIKDLSRQIGLNSITYYFKSKSISPINFIGFKALLHLYRDIFNGDIKLAKAEEYQEQYKSCLNEIIR